MRLPLPSPNLLDRLVGWVSPAAGLRRLRARAGLSMLGGMGGGGGYEAGKSDSKAMQRYSPVSRSASGDINPGLSRMRGRSRDQSRNNPLALGAVNTTVTSTVGAGLSCQPSIDQDVLGLTDEEADAWERRAAQVWSAWADTTECDIEGELTFRAMQSLVFRAILESGDILRLRRFVWDAARGQPRRGHVFATKVQLVESDRISNPNWLWDSARIQGGVQIDADGRTVGYHVLSTHPGDYYYLRQPANDWGFVPAYSPETGQRIAQLLFDKVRPGQRRGVPYLAPVIEALKQLERYTEAELMAAVVAAMFTVFVKHEGGADASPINGITGAADEGKEMPDSRGDVFLGEGLVVDLALDEDISIANPQRPNAAFDPFVMAIQRQIGAALEVPFEILTKHFQASYSASRGALIEAYKFFRTRRSRLVTWLCQPCYEDVISEAVARGELDAPGFFEDPFIRKAWLGTVWTGDAMPQIDPLKEANAAKVRIDEGLSTRDRESREMNGTSFIENHRQLRKEARLRADAGLGEVAPAPAAGPALAPPGDDVDTDTDIEDEGAAALLTAGAGA